MENKDEILANFQSITGIEDVGEAFSHLEETNWDLMIAIQNAMPQDASILDTPRNYNQTEDEKNDFSISNFSRFSSAGPSTSSDIDIIDLTSTSDSDNTKKDSKHLTFNIHFNQRIFTLTISQHSSVANLKDRIYNLTEVPTCRQVLQGWPPAKTHEAKIPSTLLCNLDLASENELVLIDMTDDGYVDDESNEIKVDFQQTYTLNIVQQPEVQTISLQFSGKKTILDVKTGVYTITDIPVRHQEWSGWPSGTDNSTTLAQSGIELQHNFVLRSNADKSKSNSKNSNKISNIMNIDTDSSADEFEDASDFNADDDFFADPPVQPRLKHLIPDQTDDETVGCIQFIQNYIDRYGDPHPDFFQGSLEDALREACHKPAKDRKLLAIYLHHDDSVLTNVFCDQLLRCESVMQTLIQNFILYGWDLTHESNKNLFLSSISACVGVTASMTVRNISVDKLPAVIIIAKTRSICEVLSVIYGNVGVDDLLSRLMEAVELYSEHIRVEVREENERAEREQVKHEQDMAYQRTLEADRAKEAAKKQKEMAIAAERKRIESEQADKDAKREASRVQAEQLLTTEPSSTTTEEVTKIRVRKPTGDFMERRFLIDGQLQDLLNFVTAKGFPIDEYKVISSWPRKDLTTLCPNETFKSLKLYPQETVTLEER